MYFPPRSPGETSRENVNLRSREKCLQFASLLLFLKYRIQFHYLYTSTSKLHNSCWEYFNAVNCNLCYIQAVVQCYHCHLAAAIITQIKQLKLVHFPGILCQNFIKTKQSLKRKIKNKTSFYKLIQDNLSLQSAQYRLHPYPYFVSPKLKITLK